MSHMLKGKGQDRLYLELYITLISAIPFVKARRMGRAELAGGNVVLAERLDALQSGDATRISQWGDNEFDLADLCATFEDQIKIQLDSPMLRGIKGMTGDAGGNYVVIDAAYVNDAVTDMSKFRVFDSIYTDYNFKVQGDSGPSQRHSGKRENNVVILRYDGKTVQITGDQFRAIKAPSLKREDIPSNDDIPMDQIVKDEKVIHPVWGMYSPAEMVVAFTEATFRALGDWHPRAMQFILPNETEGAGKLYNLHLGTLREDMSRLVVRNLGRREIAGESCQPLYVEPAR